MVERKRTGKTPPHIKPAPEQQGLISEPVIRYLRDNPWHSEPEGGIDYDRIRVELASVLQRELTRQLKSLIEWDRSRLHRMLDQNVSAQFWFHRAIEDLRAADKITADTLEYRALGGGSTEEVADALDLSSREVLKRTVEGHSFIDEWLLRHRESIEADAAEAEVQRQSSPENQSVSQIPDEVIARTIEVIGDREEALRWLGTPVRALEYATPISLLHNEKGCEAVLNVLGRLEHGIL